MSRFPLARVSRDLGTWPKAPDGTDGNKSPRLHRGSGKTPSGTNPAPRPNYFLQLTLRKFQHRLLLFTWAFNYMRGRAEKGRALEGNVVKPKEIIEHAGPDPKTLLCITPSTLMSERVLRVARLKYTSASNGVIPKDCNKCV